MVKAKMEEIHLEDKIIGFKIIIEECPKQFIFKSIQNQDLFTWCSAIDQNIKFSKGQQLTVYPILKIKRFWRENMMTLPTFNDRVETLDIILYRGSQFGQKALRTMTNSSYDHVGFLVKQDNGRILLIESTTDQGVGYTYWDFFVEMEWYKCYEKIVYRHLDVERKPQMIAAVEKFLKNVLHNNYSISLKKLMQKQSVIQQQDQQAQKDKTREFFCSELVASAYKRAGLLPQDKSAMQYWPGDFAQKNSSFPLLNGVLSEEFLLYFDE
eukprot:TRINITY_DN6731_c0_g1_i1.p1 TRINITY_DN6731_c0_g1~~TRINITY_DN6731_c0_g1_i1.p1  ORF type:complete len:268 (-),score=39.93 TRINITY_DN6731_c0_g1_i1:177-980(-)